MKKHLKIHHGLLPINIFAYYQDNPSPILKMAQRIIGKRIVKKSSTRNDNQKQDCHKTVLNRNTGKVFFFVSVSSLMPP
jgi:hypothetical protein